MQSAVPFERAKAIIQNWFNDFCNFHGKPKASLQISEEGDPQPGFYAIKNLSNGKCTKICKSEAADYQDSGSVEIPGELKGEIWDSFQDL